MAWPRNMFTDLLLLCASLWLAGFLSEQEVFSTGRQESAHVHHCLSFPQIQFCKQL